MPKARSLPPLRPLLAEEPSRFLLLERAVEVEYRPRMLEELQRRVDKFAKLRASRYRCVLIAGDPWFARMCGRFPGGHVSDACGCACRVTVAKLVDANPGLFWISWASNQGVSAAPSRDCWRR